jgi:hypothetical protein
MEMKISKNKLTSVPKRLWCIVVMSALSLLATCAPNGSGTGVGNGIVVGKVIHDDATPVENAQVHLRSEQYLADTSGAFSTIRTDTTVNCTTDSQGCFRIDSVKKGNTYWIEIIDSKDSTGNSGVLYVVDIIKDAVEDTFYLSTETVKPLKTIKGTLTLQGLPQNAYVLIYGMERYAKTDSVGKFTIANLPVGNCEDAKCEYDLEVLDIQADGTIKPFEYELEILRDNAERIIYIELELSDTLDADDFIPENKFDDSTVTFSGFPANTSLSFSDSTKMSVKDSSVIINVNRLTPDTCTGVICDYFFNAYIPESIGTIQLNRYIMKVTKNVSGRIESIKLSLINKE